MLFQGCPFTGITLLQLAKERYLQTYWGWQLPAQKVVIWVFRTSSGSLFAEESPPLCVCLLPQSAWVQCLLNTRYKVSGFFMKVGPVSKGFASTRGSHRWVEVLFRVYFCPVSPSASSFFFCFLLVITRAFTNEFPACTHSSQYMLAEEPVTRYKWIPYWSDITGCIKIDDYYSGMLV